MRGPSDSYHDVKVGFIGGAIVATGLLGFFAFLHGKHERKFLVDKTGSPAKVSSCRELSQAVAIRY